MSAAQNSTADAATDPLLQFLAADVPLRTLLRHGAQPLDWLASLETSPIVMTYPDGCGGMVAEEVSKLRLIELGHLLGMTPDDKGDCDALCWKEAIIWEDATSSPNRVEGIWFVHEKCCDWDAGEHGAPLTIPPDRLRELQRESKERRARYAAENERRKAEAEAKRAQEIRDGQEILIESRIALHRRKGVEITRDQAEREVEDMVQGFRGIRELAVDLAAIVNEGSASDI